MRIGQRPPTTTPVSVVESRRASASQVEKTCDASPADVDPANRGAAQQAVSGPQAPSTDKASRAPAPVRAAIAAGEHYEWLESMTHRPSIAHEARAGAVLVAGRPGSTIRVYNRMAEGEPGKPKLIGEAKVHPMAKDGDMSPPFSGNRNRFQPSGRPIPPPNYFRDWEQRASEFKQGFQDGEVAVRIPFGGDWNVGDRIMIVNVGPKGTESAPFETVIERGHLESRDRVPTLNADRMSQSATEIAGGKYSATPGAKVHLLVNNGVVASTTADDEGRFTLPRHQAPGQTVEVEVGLSRALLSGAGQQTDEQRVNSVFNRAMAQLSQAPSRSRKLSIDIDGAGAGGTLRIDLPSQNAQYEFKGDSAGRLRGEIEWVAAGEALRLSYELPGGPSRSGATQASAPDGLMRTLRSVFALESETTIRTAGDIFGKEGPLAGYASDETKMLDAMHGLAIAGKEKGLTAIPSRPTDYESSPSQRHYYNQEVQRVRAQHQTAWSKLGQALQAAGASEAMMAGLQLGRDQKASASMTTVKQAAIEPGREQVFTTGGGARGTFGAAKAVNGRVWAFEAPGIQRFIFAGANDVPFGYNPDAITITATLDQRTGKIDFQ